MKAALNKRGQYVCRGCHVLKPDIHFNEDGICFDCEGNQVRARWVAAKTTVETPVFTMAALLVLRAQGAV